MMGWGSIQDTEGESKDGEDEEDNEEVGEDVKNGE